jgi:hypothetical protein
MTKKKPGWQWWHWLLITASLGIIISAIIHLLTPSQQPAPTPTITQRNLDQSAAQLHNLTFEGTEPDWPEQLAVYRQSKQILSESKIKQVLLDHFQLLPHQKLEQIWVSADYSMYRAQNAPHFHLSRNQAGGGSRVGNGAGGGAEATVSRANQLSKTATINSPQLIIDAAQQQVDQLFPQAQLKPIKTKVEYFQGTYHLEPAKPGSATVAKIPFAVMIDQRFPIYLQQSVQANLTLTMNADQQLLKLVVQAPIQRYQAVAGKSDMNRLRVKKAVEQINQGQASASIIEIEQAEHGALNLADIKHGVLKDVKLEYRYDPNQQLLYPMYRLSGQAQTNDGQTLAVQIVTPAIKTRGYN